MKVWSKDKVDSEGRIFSNDMVTEKEGYEAMLYRCPLPKIVK